MFVFKIPGVDFHMSLLMILWGAPFDSCFSWVVNCWSWLMSCVQAVGPYLSPPEAAHVFRHRPYPLPPFTPLRSSGTFLNILPMSALSLINVKLQLEDKASILCAAPSDAHTSHCSDSHGQRNGRESDMKGMRLRKKEEEAFLQLSLSCSLPSRLYQSLCSFSASEWEETIVVKNTFESVYNCQSVYSLQ